MKFVSPDIAWHGQKQRILSIDFHPFSNQFVTAGSSERIFSEEKDADFYSGCVKVWHLNFDNLNQPECKYGLSQLTANVNVVKYSPNGRYLAVANDLKEIIVYVERESNRSFSSQQKIFKWTHSFRLNGHGQDVVDLCWSKNSSFLVSGSMDGRVLFWQTQKQKDQKLVTTFDKAVQGVAVHPNLQYIIAVSNDQKAKMMGPVTTNKKSRPYESWYPKKNFEKYHYQKGVLDKEEVERQEQRTETFKMFANQSVASFFRRPAVSPDGQMFILPCGIWRSSPTEDPLCCAYLFRKNYYTKPSFAIKTSKQPVLVCKFCPVLFKKPNPEEGLFKQPYYMVFAIATTNSVILYNTESMKPLYGMGNFHFAALTDLCWKDHEILAVSSSDGFISFFKFPNNQLGQIYQPEQGVLKQMITKTKYVPEIKIKQNTQQVVQQQQTIKIQTATGIKKKIIPKTISKPQ